MSRLIFEGDTISRFGKKIPTPFIDKIKIYDQNTKILNDRTEWLVDRIDVMQDALDDIQMSITDLHPDNQNND